MLSNIYTLDMKLIGRGSDSLIYGVDNTTVQKTYKNHNIYLYNQTMFEREKEILYKLKNINNIVDIVGYNSTNKTILLKKYENNLNQIYNQLSKTQIIDIFIKCALTFQEIHNTGIVHNDIKGQNILITNNTPYICDFSDYITELNEGNNEIYTNDYTQFMKMVRNYLKVTLEDYSSWDKIIQSMKLIIN